jgi:hypothetical protein
MRSTLSGGEAKRPQLATSGLDRGGQLARSNVLAPLVPVYTTRFYTGNPANGATLYTVPAGKVAIIRDLDVRNGSATAGIFGITVAGVTTILSPSLAQSGFFHLETRYTVAAGETIVAVVTAGSMHCQITGYLFDA